jgi:GntR family transcriptional regulator
MRAPCNAFILAAMPDLTLQALQAQLASGSVSPGAPKYARVFDAFADAIRRGHLKPGQRLPAEAELCARLPVSLGTLQKALAQLVASGLVVRNRKTGTFVADRRSQASDVFVYRFKDPVTGEYKMPFVRVLAVQEDTSQGPWRNALHADRCVRLDRLLWVEQDPPAFTSVYFSYEHGKLLLQAPLETLHGSSTHRVMADHFNLPTLRVEHRVGCRELSAPACERLMIPKGTLGTIWDVSDFSFQDQPVLFQRLQLPPGHRPLEMSESFAGWKPQSPADPAKAAAQRP